MRKLTPSKSLSPAAHAIVYPSKTKAARIEEFEIIITLNEAHLVMLYRARLLPRTPVQKILKLLQQLRNKKFSPLLTRFQDRGAYLLLENYLIEKLGLPTAGVLHMGRSRNDMNATIFKLRFRNFFQSIYEKISLLRGSLLKQVARYQNLAMPMYSQFQVAQVGTYAFYLLAIEAALARHQSRLKSLFSELDISPLGAGAGCGTSFSIQPKKLAALLGFSQHTKNALDAVANRDVALMALSDFSVLGTLLSRVAQDFQLWTTQEFSFFEIPDDLCGGSSMMPQKKNPFLLEVIKGKSTSAQTALTKALSTMHNTAFSNSFEVGTEALRGIETAFQDTVDAITLLDLIVTRFKPIEKHLKKSIQKGVAFATGLAELAVQEEHVPFRKAYREIAARIRLALEQGKNPAEMLLPTKNGSAVNEYITWAHRNEFGGGPGKNATQIAIRTAKKLVKQDTQWMRAIEKKWKSAALRLHAEIQKM